MSQGIAELKLKQRLLREQVGMLDDKAKRCEELLHRRRAAKASNQQPNMHGSSRGGLAQAKGTQALSKRSLLRETAASYIKDVGAPLLPSAEVVMGPMADLRRKQLTRRLHEDRRLAEENAKRPPPGPGKAGAYKRTSLPDTLFPVRHARNELPCSIEHVSFGLQLTWVCPLNMLDYDTYLPMFVEGLCCPHHPFDFMARQACHELLEEAQGSPDRIIPTLPKVMPLLRTALTTKHPEIVSAGLQVFREMALSSPEVGLALVPYYRLLLGVLNLFVTKRLNLGDDFDYSQNKVR
jgi:hypothetical protein